MLIGDLTSGSQAQTLQGTKWVFNGAMVFATVNIAYES